MVIFRNNTIFLKSDDEFYFKEERGLKPNTLRFLHDLNEIRDMLNFCEEFKHEWKFINIQKTGTVKSFKRTISDITQVPSENLWCWVISWKHEG